MQNDIARRLRQERGAGVFFTSMLDVYALATDFPGLDGASGLAHVPYERVKVLEAAWAEVTGDPRFVPHLQLHEFEAILFTDIVEVCDFLGANREAASLQQIASRHESPELIDDGPHTAPSKRIETHIRAYRDLKVIAGPECAARIGLPGIRAACPHFGRWLTRLEQLGAGTP